MLTAKDNKKKKSGLPTIMPPKPSLMDSASMARESEMESARKPAMPKSETVKDLGQMKLQGIMDKISSDRELESIKEVSGEAQRITEKFKKDPDEAWKESTDSYPNALKKLQKRKAK